VIWPAWNHFSIIYGEDSGSQAIEDLAGHDEEEPDEEAYELVNYLLRTNSVSKADAICAVCDAACRWRDASIWTQALYACAPEGAGALLGADQWNKAVKAFGFTNIRPRCVFRQIETWSLTLQMYQVLRKR
jgi:hypothetical protein